MKKVTVFQMAMVLFLCMSLAVPPGLMAQGAKEETAKRRAPLFRPEEIDQLMAPIALYPDSLLAQVLAASTYPLEIVQAARFVEQNKELKGEKLMAAAKDKDWDPSVKAMLEFPDVLKMMNEKLEWTEKLGDAFLSQQKDVMESAQRLRKKAQESGNLKTTKEQKVIVEQETKTIIIEPANPQVVYVPTYSPTVVYGAWPYPAYPPYPVYPSGYVAAAAFSFAAGVAVGAAWSGYGGWGCGWGNNEVDVNVNKQNTFTQNNYNNSQKYQKRAGAAARIRIGSITRNTARVPSTRTRERPRSMDSRVPGPGPRPTTSDARGYGRAQAREAVGGLKPATSVVAEGDTEVVESLKRATSVVAEGARMPWVALGREETNVLPVIEARRAAVLLPAARAARVGRRAAAHRAVAEVPVAAVEDPPAAVAAVGAEKEIGKRSEKQSSVITDGTDD